MAWTGVKAKKFLERGQVSVQVQFTDGKDSFEEVYRTTAVTADWPDSLIRAREKQLDALAIDFDKVTLGARDEAPVVVVKPPTQDQIDLETFTTTLNAYRTLKAVSDSGVVKVDAADLDAALVAMKTAYKEEYAKFLAGVF